MQQKKKLRLGVTGLGQRTRLFGKTTDYLLIIIPVILSSIGVAVIAAATGGISNDYVTKQLFALFLGVTSALVLSFINYEYMFDVRVCVALGAISVGLLALTLFIGKGRGNVSWIELNALYMQPSEFVKVFFIITYSKHLDSVKDRINSPPVAALLLLHTAIPTGLIVLQGDLGSALVYLTVMLAMNFAAGMSLLYLLGAVAVAIPLTPTLWSMLKPYQQRRILVGFDPESDPMGYGYQQILSKRAIASGGFFGKGLSNTPVSDTIPYNHTDMIYAVITETLGLFGAIIVIVLLVFLCVRVVMTAMRARKDVAGFACVGVCAVLIAQTVENIGMCLGVLPVIGITLPFLSYGGSSLLSLFLALGVVMSVSRYRTKYFFERENS